MEPHPLVHKADLFDKTGDPAPYANFRSSPLTVLYVAAHYEPFLVFCLAWPNVIFWALEPKFTVMIVRIYCSVFHLFQYKCYMFLKFILYYEDTTKCKKYNELNVIRNFCFPKTYVLDKKWIRGPQQYNQIFIRFLCFVYTRLIINRSTGRFRGALT